MKFKVSLIEWYSLYSDIWEEHGYVEHIPIERLEAEVRGCQEKMRKILMQREKENYHSGHDFSVLIEVEDD